MASSSSRRIDRQQFWQRQTRKHGQGELSAKAFGRRHRASTAPSHACRTALAYWVPRAKPLFVSIVLFGIIIDGAVGRASARERSGETSGQGRPNVVLVLTDNQGYGDVGIHGNDKISTPNINRFATDGVQFSRFYCCPMCAPTRASVMTGRDYYRTGVIHTSRGGAKMHGDEVTIAEVLGAAGYRTAIFGKWHLGDNYPMRPQDQGFQEVLVHKSGGIGQTPDKPNSYFDPIVWKNGQRMKARGYCTDVFTDAAMRFIEENRDRAFFVYLAYNAVHSPFAVDAKYSRPHRAIGLDAELAEAYGMFTNLDENFGRLLAKLDELDLRDNTLVIFLSDNGPQNPERYNGGLRSKIAHVYEGGIRVPCFMQWPTGFQGGRKVDRISAHIDLLPTLAEVCGATVPTAVHLDGVNLLPLLRDRQTTWPDRTLFLQCHRGLRPEAYHHASVITQRYKLVMTPESFNREWLNLTAFPGAELYDLVDDRAEANDVAASHPQIVAKLRRAYEAWFEDVRNTRNFTPGYISLGSDAENPTHLCRYQDSAYCDGQPTGWPVRILRGGRYEFTINRRPTNAKCTMFVKLDGQQMSHTLAPGENKAVFPLPSGKAKLQVWVEEEGKPRVIHRQNDTIGDVDVRRIRERSGEMPEK